MSKIPVQSTVAGRWLRAGAAAALVVAGLALAHSVEAAYSAFLGGLVCLVSGAYFAWRIFVRAGNEPPEAAAGTMLRAEAGKIVLAVSMIAAAIAFVDALNVLALVVGYLLVQASLVAMSLTAREATAKN